MVPPGALTDVCGGTMLDENALRRIASFEKKPLVPGKPTMAAQEAANVTNVMGRYFLSPPMNRMSCDCSESWMRACIAWMTEPAPRNKQALMKACVMTW